MNRSTNIYDRMIFLLVVSVIFGYMGSFFTSPIILLTILFSFKFIPKAPRFFRENKKTQVVWALLIVYSSFSILWSPDFKHSLILLSRAIVHVLMCFELIVFSQYAKNPLNSISKAWVVAFCLTACVAIWEIITNNHIMVTAHDDNPEMVFVRQRAVVTFYNMNTYSLFVALSLPFLLYATQITKSGLYRLFSVIMLLVLVSILLLNASRGAIAGMVITLGVYAVILFRKGNKNNRKFVIIAAVLLGILMIAASSYLLETILYRTENRDFFQDRTRTVLMNSSLGLFFQSYGLGQGFGSMIPALTQYPANTTMLTYSHNLFLELLLEGGVFYGICFIVYYFKLYYNARRANSAPRKAFLYAVVLSLPICSVINSAYTTPTFIWLYFVSFYIFASAKEEQSVKPMRARAFRTG